jgi:hypothetical protein
VAPRVFIHVGPFKTGTTFLQQVLDANQQRLAEHGVLVPAEGTKRHAQVAADVTGLPAEPGQRRMTWEELAAEIRQWSGPTAVVSAEFLSRADEHHVTRMVKALKPLEVHVVFMARDLSRVLPAMWQTAMRAGQAHTWRSYVDAVRDAHPGAGGQAPQVGQRFWRTHDPRQVLGCWSRKVPPERIHVVTVPRSGADPSVLWERFCTVVGIEPGLCSLDVRRLNESLGTAEAELLRRVNAEVADDLSRSEYKRWVKRFVARRVLEPRPGQRRLALPEDELGWLRPCAEEVVAFLRGSGYDVVGDLAEVLPAPTAGSGVAPDDTTPEEVLDAAVDVVAALLRHVAGADGRAAGAGRRGGRRSGRAAGALRGRRRAGAAASGDVSGGSGARAGRGRRTGLRARWRNRR